MTDPLIPRLRALRESLWNYNRSPHGEIEQSQYAWALEVGDIIEAMLSAHEAPQPEERVQQLLAEWDAEVKEHGIWTSGHSLAARMAEALRLSAHEAEQPAHEAATPAAQVTFSTRTLLDDTRRPSAAPSGAPRWMQEIPASAEAAPVEREQEFLHPVNQVWFRAGLLACREYMARFVSAESPSIAASIRANWWPALGQDFGPPRKLDFAELTEGEFGTPSFRVKTAEEVSPTQEALPIALVFLQQPPALPPSTERR